MEERRIQNRPNYQESNTKSDDESRNEFPSPKIPKSVPQNYKNQSLNLMDL